MMEPVPPISAMLSEEARRGLRRFCSERGCSLTAFIEAIGLTLDEHGPLDVETVVARARKIDEERRQR